MEGTGKDAHRDETWFVGRSFPGSEDWLQPYLVLDKRRLVSEGFASSSSAAVRFRFYVI